MNNTTDGKNDRETGIGHGHRVTRKRGPTPRFSELLFERVRRRVAGGGAVGTSIRAAGMGTSRFYECVAARPRLAVDLQYTRENKLPAHMSTRAAGRSESGGRVRSRFTMDIQPGAVRQLSDRMLMLLLKQLAPEKYGSMAPPCTQSASGGEAVQQGAEIRGQSSDEIPESACDFVPQGVGGELLTPQDCPEFAGSVGTRGGGVKAAEDNRSPSPGGAVGRFGGHWHQWGLRRWAIEAGDRVAFTTTFIPLKLR